MKDDVTLINEVIDRIPNKYLATMVAAKRAKEINRGVRPLIKTDAKKPTTIALSEIAEGLIVPGPAKPEPILPTIERERREILPPPVLIPVLIIENTDKDASETEEDDDQ